MLGPNQKFTGTQYTLTAALLLGGFVFLPILYAASRPVGFFGLAALALVLAAFACAARFAWKRHSERSIPSLESAPPATKSV